MSDQPVYAYYPVFRARAELRTMDEIEALNAAHDAEILFKEWEDRVHVRGHYSTAAFRPDADLLMWWVAGSPDDVQELLTAFRRSALGRQLEQTWAFMGVTRPPETAPDHRPAFVRGEPPRRFVSVYAFVLGDWEWILAFEADDLTELVDCIRFLRESESRRYVKEETPFVTGTRKSLAEVIRDVV